METHSKHFYARLAYIIAHFFVILAVTNCPRVNAQDDNLSESLPTNKISSWKRHEALCHGSAKCTVQFSDDGLKAGSVEIPAGRLTGWTAQDKSQKRCNMFGVCYRPAFGRERQEFLISYIDEEGRKSRIMIAFVNIKAALDFKQELESFGQLTKATRGRKATQYLTAQEARSDDLTSSEPVSTINVPFSAWREVEPSKESGTSFKRYFAIDSAQLIGPGIYEYPTLVISSEGGKLYSAQRIDCNRSLVTYMELKYEGIDQAAKQSWVKPSNIDPTNISFEAAQLLCRKDI